MPKSKGGIEVVHGHFGKGLLRRCGLSGSGHRVLEVAFSNSPEVVRLLLADPEYWEYLPTDLPVAEGATPKPATRSRGRTKNRTSGKDQVIPAQIPGLALELVQRDIGPAEIDWGASPQSGNGEAPHSEVVDEAARTEEDRKPKTSCVAEFAPPTWVDALA